MMIQITNDLADIYPHLGQWHEYLNVLQLFPGNVYRLKSINLLPYVTCNEFLQRNKLGQDL